MPRYGEIASPEEQRAAAGLPPLGASEVRPVATDADAPAAPATGTVRGSSVDRFVTIALLAYGLLTVITSGLSYLDLATVINQAMGILGVDGEFTNFAQGKLWGTAAAIVLAGGWVATAFLSLRRLRTGKRTWWVPIVGAVCTSLLVSICIAVPMMGDPAFIEYVGSASRG